MLKLNKNGIEVGDKVVIKDIENIYSRYALFLFAYPIEEMPHEGFFSDKELSNWRYALKPDADGVYSVKFIGLHDNEINTLCVIANETNTFIVGVENLEKVEGVVDEAEKKYLNIRTEVSELYKKAYKMDVDNCPHRNVVYHFLAFLLDQCMSVLHRCIRLP